MCDGIVCHTVCVSKVCVPYLMREGILRNGISVCVCIIFIVGRDYVRLCRQIIKIFDADDIIFRRTDGLHRAVAAENRIFPDQFPGGTGKRRTGGKTSLTEYGMSEEEKNTQKKGKKKPAGFLASGRFYRKICKCKPHMMCRSFLTEKR